MTRSFNNKIWTNYFQHIPNRRLSGPDFAYTIEQCPHGSVSKIEKALLMQTQSTLDDFDYRFGVVIFQ